MNGYPIRRYPVGIVHHPAAGDLLRDEPPHEGVLDDCTNEECQQAWRRTRAVEAARNGMGGDFPQRNTELDDEIEQILGNYIGDALWRIQARNEICAAIMARGYDVYKRPV